MTNVEEMKTLITQLNAANEAYYAKSVEIMSNFEYDQLYDKLLELETMTGIRLSGSPTQKVGYMPTSKLPKDKVHNNFIQLLCETGVIGFFVIATPMILLLIQAYYYMKNYSHNKQNKSIVIIGYTTSFGLY